MRYATYSCSAFFSGRSCTDYSPHRVATHPKGQRRVLGLARCALGWADLLSDPKKTDFKKGRKFLGDVKIILNFAYFPTRIAVLQKNGHELKRAVHARQWGRAGTLTMSGIKRISVLAGDVIFKPLFLIGDYVDLGESKRTASKAWYAISLTKSCAKISSCVGKLYIGTEHRAKEVVDIALEGWDLCYTVMRHNNIKIHPVATLVLCTAKSLFGLYKVWSKLQ